MGDRAGVMTTGVLDRRRRNAGARPLAHALNDLLHHVATTMLTEHVDVRAVAGRLCHRSAATTLNVYSRFIDSADRGAADRLGNIFDEVISVREDDASRRERSIASRIGCGRGQATARP